MPMIDVYAVKGTFGNKPELTEALNECLMRWEKVPHIHLFLENTASFVHDLEADAMANAAGESNYVRIQILTPVGTLDREKKLGVTKEMTDIVARLAGDPTLVERTWCLITEAPDGGWGIDGHAYLSTEILDAARKELTGLASGRELD